MNNSNAEILSCIDKCDVEFLTLHVSRKYITVRIYTNQRIEEIENLKFGDLSYLSLYGFIPEPEHSVFNYAIVSKYYYFTFYRIFNEFLDDDKKLFCFYSIFPSVYRIIQKYNKTITFK